MKNPLTTSWPALALAAAVVIGWEMAARALANPNFPAFSRVIEALAQNGGVIAAEMAHTLRRALSGLALAIASMIPLGILIGRVRVLGDVFEPLIDMLRPLPPPAIIPVVMLFAGIGDMAKITVIFYTCAFPILIHAIDGVRGTHPMLGSVARSMRLTRLESMMLMDLPAALPVLMIGIRLAVGAALLVSVTSEMLISTDGIGVYLLKSQEHFRMADGLAGILVIAAVGWCVNAVVLALDRRLLHWHYASTGSQEPPA